MIKSETLPAFIQNVDCKSICEKDGMFTTVALDKYDKPQVTCASCPSDSIAIRSGFIYDALMDSETIFPDPSKSFMNKFQA